jgi:hypothetical protein
LINKKQKINKKGKKIMTTNAELMIKLQELEQWKDKIVKDLRREAEDRGWCEEFNAFMKDHGVASEPVPYRADIEASINFTINLDASDADDAEEMLNRSDMDQALKAMAVLHIQEQGLDSFDVVEVNRVW